MKSATEIMVYPQVYAFRLHSSRSHKPSSKVPFIQMGLASGDSSTWLLL